jgi:hypothetical protein
VDIHLPLSRLLNLHVAVARSLGRVRDAFLGRPASSPPYIIALAGSPAVGKSTSARVLRALLARWPDHPEIELVATDGFLHPTRVLEERQLMRRKGFPESYDLRRMVRFLAALKAGQHEVAAPVYSHPTYDIVPDERERRVGSQCRPFAPCERPICCELIRFGHRRLPEIVATRADTHHCPHTQLLENAAWWQGRSEAQPRRRKHTLAKVGFWPTSADLCGAPKSSGI